MTASEHAARLRAIAVEMARSAKAMQEEYLPLVEGDAQRKHAEEMVHHNQRISDECRAAADFLEEEERK